jgi:hypothetical protein
MSNGPKFFVMSLFQEIEDREKKKSTGDATRQERGPTSQARLEKALGVSEAVSIRLVPRHCLGVLGVA